MQKIYLGDFLMLVVFFRALILYIIVFIVIRLMGKRELSKVQPFELAIIILIADLASGPMSSKSVSLLDGIIPILTLLVSYLVFTIFIQSNDKVQNTLCGTISLLIVDGKIDQKEFDKQEYTVSELMEQLREKDVYKIQDVKYAILENNGNLNVIRMSDNISKIPLNIVEDGEFVERSLELLAISKENAEKILQANNVKKEDILVGTMDENSKFIYQLKSKKEVKK